MLDELSKRMEEDLGLKYKPQVVVSLVLSLVVFRWRFSATDKGLYEYLTSVRLAKIVDLEVGIVFMSTIGQLVFAAVLAFMASYIYSTFYRKLKSLVMKHKKFSWYLSMLKIQAMKSVKTEVEESAKVKLVYFKLMVFFAEVSFFLAVIVFLAIGRLRLEDVLVSIALIILSFSLTGYSLFFYVKKVFPLLFIASGKEGKPAF